MNAIAEGMRNAITERLREELRASAKEIERLKSKLQIHVRMVGEAAQKAKNQAEEIERLRCALETICIVEAGESAAASMRRIALQSLHSIALQALHSREALGE